MRRILVGILASVIAAIFMGSPAPAQVGTPVPVPNTTAIPGGYNPCDNPRRPAYCTQGVQPQGVQPQNAGGAGGSGISHADSGASYFALGTQYLNSNDDVRAFAAYMQSAKMGYAKGQAAVGNMLDEGDGVPKNETEAAYWLKKAADQGHKFAQYNIAGMYEEGVGVSRDDAAALRYFLASARQGYDRAELRVGLAYAVGDIAPRNVPLGISYLRQSGQTIGVAATVASVLSSPGTPQFTDIDQITNYLQAQARQAAAGSASAQRSCGSGGPMACFNAARAMEQYHNQIQNEYISH